MKLYFWQNSISPHQFPYIESLAQDYHCEVTLITEKDISIQRKQMGWQINTTESIKVVVNPSDDFITQIFDNTDATAALHCFSGIGGFKMVEKAFKKSLGVKVKRVIISEGVNLKGIRFLLRFIQSNLRYFIYRNKIDLVLAIGENARIYYSFFGIPPKQIKPFFYCVESTIYKPTKQNNGKFTIAYIGQLIHRKGVDLLLNALNNLANESIVLDIYGSGAEENKLKQFALSHKLKNVNFNGVVENNKVPKILSNYDCLVLPSRYDGWGAVVNEALMAGTPVICSDNCGAKDLIETDLQGSIFKTDNINDLTQKLKNRFQQGAVNTEIRNKLIAWSQKINKKSIAGYFLKEVNSLK